MSQINWRKAVLTANASMADAIAVLEESGLRIVLVCDDSGRLTGTITDGDIRRGLLKGFEQSARLAEIMNSNPTAIHADEDRENILDLMHRKKILHLPIVDDNSVLIGLETLEHFFEAQRLDNPVFLMAGGFGTRLHPLTHEKPKPLLKVGSKPILQTILEQFVHYGFSRFFVSTHYKADMVRAHFGDGSDWGVDIEYLHEHDPLGTAGGLGLLDAQHKQQPMIVMNGDLLTRVNFQQLLEFHTAADAAATMCIREYRHTIPYGVVTTEGNRVAAIEEKPVSRYAVNAGIYVLGPEVLNAIPVNEHIDMTTLLQQTIASGANVVTFPIHEYWLDIGRMEDYERANNEAIF